MCKKEELVNLEISINDLEYLSRVFSWFLNQIKNDCQLTCFYQEKFILSRKLIEFIDKYYEEN